MIFSKKFFIACAFFCLPALAFAEENDASALGQIPAAENSVKFKENISLALLWRRQTDKEGGLLELGYPIYKGRRHFFIRGAAAFEFCNGGKTSGHQFFTYAGELKFMFGGRLDREKFRFVTYGYFAPQFGGGSSTAIDVGHNPTYISVAGGAAFEFFFSPGQSFFVEYGGGAYIPLGSFEQRPGALLTLGHRYFLN